MKDIDKIFCLVAI